MAYHHSGPEPIIYGPLLQSDVLAIARQGPGRNFGRTV